MFALPAIGAGIASAVAGKGANSFMNWIGLEKGGKIQKTGLYKLHKGELVVPAVAVARKAPSTKSTVTAKGKIVRVDKTKRRKKKGKK